MYWLISTHYLSKTSVLTEALNLVKIEPHFVSKIEKELELIIEHYNNRRLLRSTEKCIPWEYLRNSRKLSLTFPLALPKLSIVLSTLNANKVLEQKVFTTLQESIYFQEVWNIPKPKHLLINLMILVYRTTILFLNGNILLNPDGSQKVQISSTLEEIAACLKVEGVNTIVFDATKMWLTNWKKEGFDKRLYEITKPYLQFTES